MDKSHSQTLKAQTAMPHAGMGALRERPWECPASHPTSLAGQGSNHIREAIVSQQDVTDHKEVYTEPEKYKERLSQAAETVCATSQKQRRCSFLQNQNKASVTLNCK